MPVVRLSKKPDPILVKDQLQALQTLLKAWGTEQFCASMFWVLPKEELKLSSDISTSIVVPFVWNRIQKDLFQHIALHNLLLKARQIGGTTFFLLVRLLLNAITKPGCGCVLISQSGDFVEKHFRIAHRAYRYIGAEDATDWAKNDLCLSLKQHLLHTQYVNRRELFFDQIDSHVLCQSAEVEEAGQGFTIHHILADEYSRWPGKPESTLSNVRGALVYGGSVDKNCTANGAAGPFFEDCMLALSDPKNSDAKLHFYPWWHMDDYTHKLTAKEAKEQLTELQDRAAEQDEKDPDVQEAREEVELAKRIRKELKEVTWHEAMQKIAWRRQMKKEQRSEFDEKYPEDVLTAFLVSGNQYFDRDILRARKMELTGLKPEQVIAGNGDAKIFKKRIPGRRYLIGADVATGRTINSKETDYCAAVVLDIETGEEMASYRARVRPEDLAYDLADLGRYYNDALIAVERTGDGGTTILTLQGECQYTAVYKHREWFKRDRRTPQSNTNAKFIDIEGFPTTPKTRPIALNKLNDFICTNPEMIYDEMFLNEALVFVRDEKGIPKAQEGAHDDTVMCRAVAYYVRLVLLGYLDPNTAPSEKYQFAPVKVA